MKITAIKQQAKKANRFSIFIDGKYSFSLSDSELLHSKIAPNQQLSSGELDKLKATAEADKAFSRALNLFSYRPRSEWEIREYLKRNNYEAEVINVVLAKLVEYGYVNDEKFAVQWVENRRLLRTTSRRRLQQELRLKHISDEFIELALQKDIQSDQGVLHEIVAKKRARYPDTVKLMQYLARQGFKYEDIKHAVNQENND